MRHQKMKFNDTGGGHGPSTLVQSSNISTIGGGPLAGDLSDGSFTNK